MRVRAFVLAAAFLVPATVVVCPSVFGIGPRTAEAAVSVVLSLNELVSNSSHVVVAKAAERQSIWEETPSGRRIVTYTRLDVERSVVGDAGTSVWVRTLGGAVGSTGQWVSGEAVITPGSRSLLFLSKSGETLSVTAMGQGHYPIVTEGAVTRVTASADAGTLLLRRGPTIAAREVLVGTSLDKALQLVGEARRAQKERK